MRTMKASSRPVLRVVILAAGFSRRLGTPKALARVHGVGLLRRTATLLAAFGDGRTIVVAPPRQGRFAAELRGLEVELCVNARTASGLSSSVRLGLARARGASAVLLVPVDLVDLRARDIARLVTAWRAAPRRVIARRIGTAGGTPLILPRALFGTAATIDADHGLREVVCALAPERRRLLPLPSAAADVDERRDLLAARRRLRGRGQTPRK
ncbi:MAG TPA: nucleotidyltransferase family protein [Steroidobacteraceae bacterium]|nr:nucleotidyltransferase family protein [Steroidobacteraceae bacterium]